MIESTRVGEGYTLNTLVKMCCILSTWQGELMSVSGRKGSGRRAGGAPFGGAKAAAQEPFVRSEVLPLEALGRREMVLGQAITYWGSLRAGDRIPDFGAVDIRQMSMLMGGYAHFIDATSAEPANFFCRLFGSAAAAAFRMPNMTGTRVGQTPWPLMRRNAERSYWMGVNSDAPVVQRVAGYLGDGIQGRYMRLMMPFSERDGRASRLIVGILPLAGKAVAA